MTTGKNEINQNIDLDHDSIIGWFRHAAPYINAHRGKTFVLMLTGEAIQHPNFINTVHDIALLNSLGVKLVLAIGARPHIEVQLKDRNIKSEIFEGLRVTNLDVLQVVKQAVGAVRSEVEALLSTGVINSPMHGADIRVVSGNFITAKPIGVRDGIDFGYTGEIRKIASREIASALESNAIVLLPSLGYSPSGEVFNLSVEDVATKAAIDLRAHKLIALTEENGAINESGDLLKELRPGDCASLLNAEWLSQEQRQAIRSCYNAIDQGVPRAHLISYIKNGSLLGELFTRDGSGTLMTQGSYEQIRPACIDDVGGILELITPLEEQGVLVKRSRELLESEIENFTVIERDGMVVSCLSLYNYLQDKAEGEKMAEIACVATHPDYVSGNRASLLLQYVEAQAKQQQIKKLFVLTTQTAHWFVEKGFVEAKLDALPLEKQKLYNYQRNSKIFIKHLEL